MMPSDQTGANPAGSPSAATQTGSSGGANGSDQKPKAVLHYRTLSH